MSPESETLRIPFQVDLLRRLMGIFGLFLFLTSWKLWTAQTVFPQVPFFQVLIFAPGVIDWIALAATVIGLLGMAAIKRLDQASDRITVRSVGCFLFGLSILILLDQHRLQPWAYQLWILGVLYLTLSGKQFLLASRMLLISIYVYSAISKWDYQFANTVGYEISNTLASFFSRAKEQAWDSDFRWSLAVAAAIYELSIGVLLASNRRLLINIGVMMGILMHAVLILALGPWGMNHHWPVLLWNLFCVSQLVTLFGWLPVRWMATDGGQEKGVETDLREYPRGPGWLGATLIVGVLVFPLTSFWGLADHWVSWELYSPRSSRVEIVVPGTSAEVAGLGNAVSSEKGDSRLDLNQWSLKDLGVPVYPQARFQVGCAIEVRDRLVSVEDELSFQSASIRSTSDRLTGVRKEETVRATAPNRLEDHAGRYWLNAYPRKHDVFWIR